MLAEKQPTIPHGATHSTNPYNLGVQYFRIIEDFVGVESGTQWYCWASWEQGKWIKDRTICSRHFKRIE